MNKIEYILNSLPLSREQRGMLMNGITEYVNDTIKAHKEKHSLMLLNTDDTIEVVIGKINEIINIINN